MGVHLLLHRAQRGHRKRLAVPGARLQVQGEYWPLIGRDSSRDLKTSYWLLHDVLLVTLQERRRLFPHSLLRHPDFDREAHVLPGARPRTVLTGNKR
mgnify:CR=1 FL=1